MTSRQTIEDFLACRRLAVVGVSRSKSHFTRMLFRELLQRGYDAVPVNPSAEQIEQVKCSRSVRDINPPVEAVLVMTPAAQSNGVVEDCVAAGAKRVWLYRAVGAGSVSPEALKLCEAHRLEVVDGHCPYMFLPGASWFHRLHGGLLKLTGRYPR